jgi:enoyl-CoA hydratase/carnithine racemase
VHDDLVTLTIEAGIATVALNRPTKLNALTPAMIETLAAHATRIDGEESIRCVVLTAAGDKAFCVGADINDWSALEPLDMWRRWTRRGHQVFDQWARLRVPVVAAINGHALGGGLELAAVADIRVADRRATFGLPEAGIATCPGWSGTQRIARLIGTSRVKYLALTGRRLSAEDAWRVGLVQELSEPGKALDTARAIATDIARQAPISVQLTKQLIDGGAGEGLAAAFEGMAGALAASTRDAKEGMRSFREKREPRYEGR